MSIAPPPDGQVSPLALAPIMRGRDEATMWTLPSPRRLGSEILVVVGSLVLATWLRLLLNPILGEKVAFVTYFPAVILLTRWCSIWPALLSCVGATVLADLWFLEPRTLFITHPWASVLQLGLFLAVSIWLVVTARSGHVAREQAEERGRELEAVLKALPVGVAIARDRECQSIEGNDTLRRMTGMDAVEDPSRGRSATTSPFRVLRNGRDVPVKDLPLRLAAREGRQVLSETFDVQTQDGRFAQLMVSAVPLVDATGAVHGAVGVTVDVTEQRVAEYRYRMALRSGRMVAWSWDSAADVITMSDTVSDVYGLTPDQTLMEIHQAFALLHPDDRDHHIALVREAVRTGGSYQSTFRIRRPVDGRIAWLEERAEVVHDPHRHATLIGIVMDVTVLKHREEALAHSESTFRSLIEGASHIIWHSAPDGRLTYVNGAWLRYTGQSLERALLGWNDIFHPDDLQPATITYLHAVQQGTTWEAEYRLRSATGIYRWWQGRSWPVLDVTGAVVAWHGIAVDIHEQREARAALQRSEEFNRRIIQSSGDCIKILDLEGRLLSMNEGGLQAMEICDFDVVRNQFWPALWNGASRSDADHAIATALAGGAGRFQGFCATRAGNPKWWDVVVTPILGSDGRPERLLAASRDITSSRASMVALQEAEERFRTLAETMPQMVWVAGPDGKLRWTNRHWVEYLGSEIQDSRNAGWAVFHPDDAPQMFSSWRTAQDEKRPYQLEVRTRRGSDGAFRWFLVRAIPQLDKDGAVTGWIGTCTDIHDLKEAEQAMRSAAERDRNRELQLRLALEAGSIGTWEFLPQTAELLADPRCLRLFGLTGTGTVPWSTFLSCVHPIDRARVEGAIQHAIVSGGSGECDVEYRVIGAGDGILRYLKAKGRTAFDGAGQAYRLNGTIVDLSEVRRADERDRLQAEAGALLVESFDIAHVLQAIGDLCVQRMVDWCSFDLVDEHGTVRRMSVSHRDPERIGLAHELHRRYPPSAESPTRRVLHTGIPFLLEAVTDDMIVKGAVDADHLQLIRALGLRSIIVVPLKTRDRVLGVMTLVTAESRRTLMQEDLGFVEELGRRIGLAIDNARLFTAEKAAREFAVDRAETLSQLNAELEQFAYVCSHDLQEPLRMIMQYLELTRMCLGDAVDERTGRYMNYVTESAERMRTLILDLLGYARVGNASVPEDHTVDLERVLYEATENLRGPIADSGAVITHDELPTIRGDKVQLVQVFQNLLSNAIKFRGDDRPSISITAEDDSAQCIVSVADNGIGIPMEHRERIFDVFQRLHPRERYAGSGIGLAVCRKIIVRSGGRIWVEDAPGGGTVFRFSIPRSAGGSRAQESARLSASRD